MGWDDVIGVDFTRTAQSVQRTGADLQKWAKQQETKATIFIIKKYNNLFSVPYENTLSCTIANNNTRHLHNLLKASWFIRSSFCKKILFIYLPAG